MGVPSPKVNTIEPGRFRRYVGTKTNKALRPFRVLRDEGIRSFIGRTAGRIHRKLAPATHHMLVSLDDATAVDWVQPASQLLTPLHVKDGPIHIAWITSPPGRGSGGHQNLFRFIKFAEQAGHTCSIYFYSPREGPVSIREVTGMLESTQAYPRLDARMQMYDPVAGVAEQTQAIFATGWETAYPAYRDSSLARRFYFVQDLESSFYPPGSEALLAENTYRFGFHGITAGRWLAHKLHEDFGMATDYFDFGVDSKRYFVTNSGPRGEVFFYARPVTPRRGFEFGLYVLEHFSKLRPDVKINLAGESVAQWTTSFKFENWAELELTQLNDLYNRCSAGLVMSLSNMSLLPLELLASGVTPVVNDAPNNRMVYDGPFVEYVPASPAAIARRMAEIVDLPCSSGRARDLSASVSELNWERSGAQFISAFERVMHG